MFERSFVLPEDVGVTTIRAESKEGVLTIHMPRMAVEKARPVTISVQ
jgi:HSP20 family molecular chaperone IbpA